MARSVSASRGNRAETVMRTATTGSRGIGGVSSPVPNMYSLSVCLTDCCHFTLFSSSFCYFSSFYVPFCSIIFFPSPSILHAAYLGAFPKDIYSKNPSLRSFYFRAIRLMLIMKECFGYLKRIFFSPEKEPSPLWFECRMVALNIMCDF